MARGVLYFNSDIRLLRSENTVCMEQYREYTHCTQHATTTNPQSNSLSTSRAVQHHTCIFTRSTTAWRALGTGMGHAHTLIMMIERPTLSETQASYPSTRACRRDVEGHRAASDALHNCPTHGACPDNRWWVVAMECGARGH